MVGSGGTLMGTGNVGPVTIMSGGTLAPGNSIGTMIVHKSLTFEPGSTYRVELSPADSDRVAVGRSGGTGIATLTGATVMASYDPGSYVSKKYTIIAADGGLAGTTFAGLKGSAPKGFSHKLGYDSNKAYIELDLDQVSTAASSGGASSVATGLPMNLQAAYAAIREYFNRVGQLPASFGALASDDLQKLSTGTAVPQSATQFAGAFVGAMSGGLISAGSPSPATPVASLAFADDGAEKAKADRISRRFEAGFPTAAAQPAASRYETWGSVIGSGQYLAANPTVGTVDVSAATFGVASGTDIVAGATRVGVAFGAAWSNSTLGNGAGTARVGSGSVGLRAHHDFGRFYLSGATAYGLHFASSARNFGGDVYSADFTSQSLSGRIEAGAPIGSAVATFTPYGAFQATSVWTGAYTERASGGGIFALAYQPGNTTELASELGLRAEKKVGNTTFSGGLGWTHYFSRGGNSTVGFATLPGTTFTTQGVAGPSDTAIVSLGVSHAFSSKLTVGASAHGEFGSGFSSLAGKANLKWNW